MLREFVHCVICSYHVVVIWSNCCGSVAWVMYGKYQRGTIACAAIFQVLRPDSDVPQWNSPVSLFKKKYWILAILDIKSKFQKSCWAGWIPPQGFPSPLFRLFERAHIWQIFAICCCKTHSNLKLLKFRCIVLQLTWKSSIEPIWNTWPNLYLWKPTPWIHDSSCVTEKLG